MKAEQREAAFEAAAKEEAEAQKKAAVAAKAEALKLVGKRVVLDGLAKRKDLNGFIGTCESYETKSGRLGVRLVVPPGKAPILLKPENVSLLADVVTDIAGHCAAEHADEVKERVRGARSGACHEDTGRVVLDLEGTCLAKLPSSVGSLESLAELWLGGNALRCLPASLATLQALRVLDVDGNSLSALPESMGLLAALERVYANDNLLAALPKSFSKLSALRELRLSDNRLGATATEDDAGAGRGDGKGGASSGLSGRSVMVVGLEGRPELNGQRGRAGAFNADKGRYAVQLDGGGTPLLLKQDNLVTTTGAVAAGGKAAAVPSAAGALAVLSGMPALATLWLARNGLEQQHLEAIRALPAVRELDLAGNRLCNLPTALVLENAPRLETLELAGNPLLDGLAEAAAAGVPQVRKWLSLRQFLARAASDSITYAHEEPGSMHEPAAELADLQSFAEAQARTKLAHEVHRSMQEGGGGFAVARPPDEQGGGEFIFPAAPPA